MERVDLGKSLNLTEELVPIGRDNRPGTRIIHRRPRTPDQAVGA